MNGPILWVPRSLRRGTGIAYHCSHPIPAQQSATNGLPIAHEVSRITPRLRGQPSPIQACGIEVNRLIENTPKVIDVGGLGSLVKALILRGYEVIGPTVRDNAVVFDNIESSEELPAGWTDEQAPGHYRLKRREDKAIFGYAVGPQSWKKYLHPADVKLWSAERQGGTFRILNNESQPKRPYAFLGVRACDLTAIAVQDRVLIRDKYSDPVYGSSAR